MKRLMYVSTAAHNLDDSDIDNLVQNASARNQGLNVTGALIFNGVNFAQVLEGEAAAVQELMASIQRDPRHSGLIILGERDIETRAFPNWGMRRIDGLNFAPLIDTMAA